MQNNERLAVEALATAQKCIAEAMEGVVTESPKLAGISIREALSALDTGLVATEATNDNAVLKPAEAVVNRHRYLSKDPKLPKGYATVLGYLAETNPEALDLMPDPVTDTRRDGFKLAAWERFHGFETVKVEAPEIVKEAEGVETVKAYPVEWLERRFGDAA